MNAQEALSLVETVLVQTHLSQLQKTVFCQAWEDQSYLEIARRSGYELGYVKQTGSQLWQLLSRALEEKVTKHNVQHVVQRKIAEKRSPAPSRVAAVPTWVDPAPLSPPAAVAISSIAHSPAYRVLSPPTGTPQQDWGDAVDVSTFYGRTAELATLAQWIGAEDERPSSPHLTTRCRLVGIFGMGGIGKTTLSVKLAKQVQAQFDYVIWRSLRNAPPLLDLLADLIQFLSDQQGVALSDHLDGRLLQLLDYLRQHRCLILLDNGETILGSPHHNGGYLPGYEGYEQLWHCIGNAHHQSTLVLTSREKPSSFAAQEGPSLPVRSLRLTGLPPDIGQSIFALKGTFSATDEQWTTLIDHYAGNPLALKMVAPVIQDVFAGEVASFLDCLQDRTLVFGDIHDLLQQQFDRLSPMEQQVMDWLAIARKPISLSHLRASFTPSVGLGQLLDALTTLERRFLIDKATPTMEKSQIRFTLQPVVMEYITKRLIDRVCDQIDDWMDTLQRADPDPAQSANRMEQGKKATLERPSILQTHALLQAQAKDYIRETQTRLILQPIADRLRQRYSMTSLRQQGQALLAELRRRSTQTGYTAGNLINLLRQLGVDLTGWDFSHLPVWSAYLRGMTLHQVNCTGTDFAHSVFTETFSHILAVAFSPDGKLLATGDVNHDLHLWQVADGTQLLSCRMESGWVWSVAFSPDGRWLASSANRAVKVWDTQTGDCIHTFEGYTDRVFSVAFSPDGKWLATGSEDRLIRLWDLRSGRLLQTLEGHRQEVRSVAFCPVALRLPHGRSVASLLASGSFDGTVRLWDAASGTCLAVLEGHRDWVWSVAFSADGRCLASSSSDRTVKLWEVTQPHVTQISSLEGHERAVRTVAFSADGRTLASGSDDRTIRLWNYRRGDCLGTLVGHSSWISAVAFSPDQPVLASSSEDQSVRLWHSRSRLCLKTLQGYSNGIWSVAVAPDGSQLASGSQDRIIRLWHPQGGELLGHLQGHSSWIWSVAFSPTQPQLASGSEDRSVKLWDLNSHTLLQTLEGHQDAVLSVLFSPDGHWLFSGSLDRRIKQWDSHTGRDRRTFSGHTGGVWCLALSSDGQFLVSGSQDQTLKLWRVADGSCLQTLTGHDGWIRSVAISPDRQIIVSGSADGRINVWRTKEGTCLQTLAAHRGPVLSIAFHPSGQTCATCGTDGQIRCWDTASWRCLQTLAGHDRWVRFLSYSPDGRWLASCSQDETIKLWACAEPEEPIVPWRTLRVPRPYEGLIIHGATNLTPAQTTTLKMLGAVSRSG